MEKLLSKGLLGIFVFFTGLGFAQTKSISGTITDSMGAPLPGTSVIVKGSTQGTSTDFDGNYEIEASPNDILVFSYVGFATQEIPVGTQTTMNVTLVEDAAALDEVVILGYGTQKKTNVTSAVTSVDSEELNQSSVANVSNALVGRLPGLFAAQRSGQPGSDASDLLIRGIGTTGNAAPLIIVDGVQRAFNQIDPNTIENITILKDASAAAVYGVRGANGVILITTKRGAKGKPTINYTTEITSTMPIETPQYLGSYDYAVLFNEAKRNEGKAELYTEEDLEKFRTGSDPITHPNTDWYADGLKSSAMQYQHNLSISGGSDRVTYFASGGVLTQDGLVEHVDFKRYNFRSNVDFQVTDNLKVSLDLGGRQEIRNSPSNSIGSYFNGLNRNAPTTTAYYPNGLPGLGFAGNNPIEQAKSGGYTEDTNNIFFGNIGFEYQIPKIDGLMLKGYMAVDRNFRFIKSVSNPYTLYEYNPANGEYIPTEFGQSRISETYRQGAPSSNSGTPDPTTTYNMTLNYDRLFGEKHQVTGLIGAEKAVHKSNYFTASRLDLTSQNLPQLDFGDAASAQNGGLAYNSSRLGYLARVTYAYDTKYLLEASFRYDASENFAKENRWGFFPSFSAGWRLTKEKFLSNIPNLDEFKIRGSWGRLGNDRISQFQFLDAFDFNGNYIIGGSPIAVIRPGVIPNTDVTWETATISNIGFDLEMFDHRLALEFDYFTKRTEDILEAPTRIVPDFVGASLPRENFGIVDNKGVEFVLSYRDHIGGFNYWAKANYTISKNEIVEIGEPESVPENLKRTGRAIGSQFGLVAEGLFQSQAKIDNHADQSGFGAIAPGDIKYKDVSGPDGTPDGIIDDNDRDFIGVTGRVPDAIFGLAFGFDYKGFDFSTQIQGAHDFNVYLAQEAAFPFFNGGKVLEQHLDRWTPQNTDAAYPRLLTEDTNNRVQSSFWMQDADYIRLKNVEVGYNFPSPVLDKLKLSQLRLYLSGLNLFTLSDIENFDPEAPSGRGSFYPQTQSYTLGLSIGF
ncbi:SusC/RagA family TonB-linked outer membrane protein [Sediminicola luteus]|uniref:TonB-dependent receptor plug domain-containing protein n=1 Tax=Sediminicola luteus TaxID=319238 RepID=A0A2A4G3K8_9FLAO|nr:TonB-dependent receptor [Sediminicola luteus]PCE62546.1 hypothetical protein B7P33_18080 [Sediminicola luteus]